MKFMKTCRTDIKIPFAFQQDVIIIIIISLLYLTLVKIPICDITIYKSQRLQPDLFTPAYVCAYAVNFK